MKRGSALLIVLGMVAFMVVSAVAFSAYMRSSRLPSSYLRRTSSSRHLVKAALAEAIDEIDIAIGNDPYPGMGDKGTQYDMPRRATDNERTYRARRNYWRSHCYIGTNTLVSSDETVSPLCLEALAYLPPALINEVRYFSRHSPAARWHTLNFDSGRYAFAAVDVSDHFDINRIAANVGRNSSDNGRISLSHLFENETHDDWSPKPSQWDAFMDEFVDAKDAYKTAGLTRSSSSSKVPLVSLADFNLAAYDWGGLSSLSGVPFCDYIQGNGNKDFVESSSDQKSEALRSMAIVTDSYFPKSSETADSSSSSSSSSSGSGSSSSATTYSLLDEKYQPFTFSQLRNKNMKLNQVLDYESIGANWLFNNSLCGLSLAALWDYLDEDSVPLSLAIPTTERVPMIVAMDVPISSDTINISVTASMTLDPAAAPTPKAEGEKYVQKQTDIYTLDVAKLLGGFVKSGGGTVVLAYPFRRDEDLLTKSFKVGGRVAIFFSDPGMTLHTGSTSDVLHMGEYNKTSSTVQNGVFYLPFQEKQVKFSNVKTTSDALQEVELTFANAPSDVEMFKIETQWTDTAFLNNNLTKPQLEWTVNQKKATALANPSQYGFAVNSANCGLPPLSSNGTADNSYANSSQFKNLVSANNFQGNYAKEVKLQMCVWIYVKDENDKIVDLVPACLKDDGDLNGRVSTTDGEDNMIGGQPYPLLRWGGKTFETYGPDTFTTAAAAEISTYPIMCADPRWNWAPEYWFKMSTGSCTKDNWLKDCQVNTGSRDRDIFMATSDRCYLQSVYELAFLPRLGNLEQGGDATGYRGYMNAPGNAKLSELAQQFTDTANQDLVWMTYRPFALNGNTVDAFDHVGFTSDGTGFRVNPFSSSEDILMAAFANTPYNWFAASTNTTLEIAIQESDRTAEKFNKEKEYCFNAMTGDSISKFEWDDLKNIAKNFRNAVHARSDDDWQAAFDSLDWAGDRFENGDNWAGVTLSNETADLTDVDKKFLYGYWRDCFAAKQQLFLIFVRAEPAMMGGGGVKQTPPQLGARAVALVWRDPNATQTSTGAGQPNPHRTRVLFYRQFE